MSNFELKITGHPGNISFRPTREPDYANPHGYQKYWFAEMMCVRTTSAGTEDYPELLAVCPASGLLMYMSRYVPVVWNLIREVEPNEAYRQWINQIVEKEVLGGK